MAHPETSGVSGLNEDELKNALEQDLKRKGIDPASLVHETNDPERRRRRLAFDFMCYALADLKDRDDSGIPDPAALAGAAVKLADALIDALAKKA